MTMRLPVSLTALLLVIPAPPVAQAIGISHMRDFEPLFGRYAPAGDCRQQPQVTVDADGMSFEVGGTTEQVTRLEYAASYGGNFYEGISQWFMPFGHSGSHPILMTFNADEKEGELAITGHDEGWDGGPPLSARNKALVAGSPYRRCK